MKTYVNHFRTRARRSGATPQSQAIAGKNQVRNSAGGYTFQLDDWGRLQRFLILGSEGGSYYANERQLTVQNACCVERCLAVDGPRVVKTIVTVSQAGRAPKNDAAIYALAMCAGLGDAETRFAALQALPKVCRIGTHLFQFVEAIEGFRGWGRGLRTAVGRWYTQGSVDRLALQLVKYAQREGWSHRDVLRKAHPAPPTETHEALFRYVQGGVSALDGKARSVNRRVTGDRVDGYQAVSREALPVLVQAHEEAKRADERRLVTLIRDSGLPRESVPTEHLTNPAVWEALLEGMPMTAMIRNLATMTRVGLLDATSSATRTVVDRLGDAERLRRARVHPIAVLAALMTYKAGHGVRGGHTWLPVQQVVDALDGAFYASFGNVEPTGKRWMLALDVSGSMGWGEIAGVPGLTPRIASAAMAMVTARVESAHRFVAFSSGKSRFAKALPIDGIQPVDVSPRQRLDDVLRETSRLPFGGTDCALPMVYARVKKLAVEAFVVLTDSETWHGKIHPCEALQRYRDATGIPAKLIVVGMVANRFTIADPDDAGMLDVVGFDTATPQLISSFVSDN